MPQFQIPAGIQARISGSSSRILHNVSMDIEGYSAITEHPWMIMSIIAPTTLPPSFRIKSSYILRQNIPQCSSSPLHTPLHRPFLRLRSLSWQRQDSTDRSRRRTLSPFRLDTHLYVYIAHTFDLVSGVHCQLIAKSYITCQTPYEEQVFDNVKEG